MTPSRLIPSVLAAAVMLAAAVGCGTTAPVAEPAPAVTVTETAPAEPAAKPSEEEPADEPAPAAGGEKIKVPNVVGKTHQVAQDTMQAAGLYGLMEEDATGQGRMLLMDRNWVVVKQHPKAGTTVDASATITLYSKKIGE